MNIDSPTLDNLHGVGAESADCKPAFAKPELKQGEIYAGAIINPDGTGHHVILLTPHPEEEMTWQAAMAYAKELGGDLPSRVEQALLFDQSKAHFDETWYWSNTQHAAFADFAWYQSFGYGCQDDTSEGNELRARAVRRVAI